MNKKQSTILIISAIVLITLGLWIKSRWSVWFNNQPETNYTTAMVPDRIALIPGENFNTQRIVTWRCDTVVRKSYVELAAQGDTSILAAEGNLVENEGGKDVIYKVVMSNLLPNQNYSYRVVSGVDSSEWYKFTMPSSAGIKKLLYFGDIQDTIGGMSKKIFHDVYSQNNDVDAILFGGDLLERPLDKYWNYVFDSLDSISQQCPLIVTAGNHEYKKGINSYIDNRWRKTFGYCDNGATDVVGSYYVESSNVLIIVLDTQSFNKLYPAISQAKWIKQVVKNHGAGKKKIVMMHHPVNSVRKGKTNYMERYYFGPLFKDLKIDVVLAGHEHSYGRFVNEDGAETPLYIVSHCSPKNYKSIQATPDKKIIHGVAMYQTLEFKGNSIVYKAYDAKTNQLLDNYIINK